MQSNVDPGVLNRLAEIFHLGTSPNEGDPRYHLKFWKVVPDREDGIYLLHYQKAQLNNIVYGIDDTGAPIFTDAQKNALLSLRGVVYDFGLNRVLCDTDGRLAHITAPDWPDPSTVLPRTDHITDEFGRQHPSTVLPRTDHITDEFGRQHPWLLDPATKFRTGFDGTLFRFYKAHGAVRIAISQNPDILTTPNSRWGNNKESFMDLWNRLGGSDPDQMFVPDFRTSKFQHHFIIVDNSLTTGARFNGSAILYVGSRELKGVPQQGERSPLMISMSPKRQVAVIDDDDDDEIARARRLLDKTAPIIKTSSMPETSKYSPMPEIDPSNPLQGGMYSVRPIDHLRVSQILLSGYFSYGGFNMRIFPPEMRPSGFVIAEGPQGQRAKITSPGYNWRQAVNGPLPNLKARAYSFYDMALKLDQTQEREDEAFVFRGIDYPHYNFGQLFKLSWAKDMMVPTEAALLERKALIEHDSRNISYLPIRWIGGDDPTVLRDPGPKGREARLRYAMGLFAYAAPISKQAEVLGYYSQFIADRKLVSEFFRANWSVLVNVLVNNQGHLHLTPPFSDFPITEKVKNAAHEVTGTKLSKSGESMKRLFLTAWKPVELLPNASDKAWTNLHNLLGKEKGSSIHRMSHAIARSRGLVQDEIQADAA